MSNQIEQELQKISAENGGVITPAAVVAFAKNPKTELHKRFTWDNTTAAHEYRLWEARQLIASVTFLPQGKTEPMRAYVSLASDRRVGGYRRTVDVMRDVDRRAELLEQAKVEMVEFQRRYKDIKELAVVFQAMRKASKAA
jgi:hypothetical protein